MIKAYTLIVSFMPAISALSGNLGLQASANTIRGLGTGERSGGNTFQTIGGQLPGHIDSTQYFSNMMKEMRSGVLTATLVASALSVIAGVWAYSDTANKEIIKS